MSTNRFSLYSKHGSNTKVTHHPTITFFLKLFIFIIWVLLFQYFFVLYWFIQFHRCFGAFVKWFNNKRKRGKKKKLNNPLHPLSHCLHHVLFLSLPFNFISWFLSISESNLSNRNWIDKKHLKLIRISKHYLLYTIIFIYSFCISLVINIGKNSWEKWSS